MMKMLFCTWQGKARLRMSEGGNIMLMLFASIGMIGVVGATSMSIMKGPVQGMHHVTQRTIAENNIIASTKLAIMATSHQPGQGDCDGDGVVEPIGWSTSGSGPFPVGGGYLPAELGASLKDPWGNHYGYCVWDHGAKIQNGCPNPTQRLKGTATGGTGIVLAILSSGPDKIFQTSCADAPAYVNRGAGGDDVVMTYTYAEAQSLSAGLWNLKTSDTDTAEISKNLEVKNTSGDTTFALNSATGIGDFIGIKTGTIAGKGTGPVEMMGGFKVDNDSNVTQCTLLIHAGILRYHASEGLQVCDGAAWRSAGGGGGVPAGTIAAFASNSCPGGWSEYLPSRGRFMRGRDPSGTNDVVRNAGTTQDDQNKSHTHTGTAASAGSHTHTGSTSAAGGHNHSYRFNNGQGGANETFATAGGRTGGTIAASGTSGIFAAGDHTHTMSLNPDGAHTHAVTVAADGGTETRPKNVTVTFCQYNGGVSNTINELGELGNVRLTSPTVGQVLTFDGTNWVNTTLPVSQWTTAGANIHYNTGNVGIGTATPPNKLHVVGNIGATGWVGAGCEGTCEGSGGYALLYPDGSSVMTTSIRAPIFYDHDDTSYYLDPNATTRLRMLQIDQSTSYDVWIQGGTASSGTARNLAVLGVKSTDQLYINHGSEYTGGTVIGGPVTISGTLNATGGVSGYNETDPKVGAVTNGRWCRGTGTQVTCDQTAPSGGDTAVKRQIVKQTGATVYCNDGCTASATASCPAGYLIVGCVPETYWFSGNQHGSGAYAVNCTMNFTNNTTSFSRYYYGSGNVSTHVTAICIQ